MSELYWSQGGSKGWIVESLSKRWPQTAKQLYYSLQKEYSYNSSYQALHKTLISLEEEGVLSKLGPKYSINRAWILKNKTLFLDLEKKHAGEVVIEELGPKTKRYIFQNQTDFVLMTSNHLIEGTFLGSGLREGYGWFQHLIWPMEFRFMDLDLLKKISEKTPHTWILVQNDSLFDRWLEKQWKFAGFKNILLGVKADMDGDLLINGDSIIRVYYAPETKRELDEVYEKSKDLADLFKHYTKQFLNKKPQMVTMEVTQDRELAKMLSRQIKEKFEQIQSSKKPQNQKN